MCDKTCIFFFFPIIYKYLCMAKRSLLSRCPSYFHYTLLVCVMKLTFSLDSQEKAVFAHRFKDLARILLRNLNQSLVLALIIIPFYGLMNNWMHLHADHSVCKWLVWRFPFFVTYFLLIRAKRCRRTDRQVMPVGMC